MFARTLLNSERKSGSAMEMRAPPRSRNVFPCRFTAPKSVTTQCTCPLVVTTPAPGLSSGTILDIVALAAVAGRAMTGFPADGNCGILVTTRERAKKPRLDVRGNGSPVPLYEQALPWNQDS
jgi:hypothetical protein